MVSSALLAAGRKKAGVFVMLNVSARNCKVNRSVSRIFRKTEKSRFWVAGPRPARQAKSPYSVSSSPSAFNTWPGSLNAAGLNHPFGPGIRQIHRLA